MSNSCKNCKSKTLITDPTTENLICSSCGVVQDFNNYQQQLFNSDGLIGTNIQLGKSGSRYDYSYKETKHYLSQKLITDILLKLDLQTRFDDVNNMIKQITDDQYGCPESSWFNVLIGACVYVVMRKANKSIPLTSVCTCVGCDSYELGRMVYNVVEYLDLKLPDFDIVGLFDRVVKEWVGKCRSWIGKDKVTRIVKQGVFLLQCMIKWFVTTGRRPVPVVVAVIVFVCEVNGVEVTIEDLASELNVVVGTCKLRYREILDKLVEVARARLPWGKDVTLKNIMKNAPFVMQYMEVKSMCDPSKVVKSLEEGGLDLDGLVNNCLNKGDESYFIQVCGKGRSRDWEVEDLEKLKISPKCLSAIYLKYLEEYSRMKTSINKVDSSRVERSKKSDFFVEINDCYWNGHSELSKKLFLDKILEKDVGLDPMPPSYVNGCLKTKKRKEKIKAAKIRIDKIRRPPIAASDVSDCDDLSVKPPIVYSRKRKRDAKKVDIDWEDFVIETLLLHQVKEDEIEKGHYNTLLDLHVFRYEEVYFGNVLGANLGQGPARQAALGAGIPNTVVSTSVNKVCASGMKATMLAAHSIQLGHNDIVVAGGMESMSNVPKYIAEARKGSKFGHDSVVDGILKDGLWDVFNDYKMGNCAEICADTHEITREQQDDYAIQSFERSIAARDSGAFAWEIAPVEVPGPRGRPSTIVDKDDDLAKFDAAKLRKLRPAFKENGGSVTAGNSSGINDGAAALVLVSGEKALELGLNVIAKISGYADAEQAPELFTTTPALAIPKAISRAGLDASQIDFYEINEAFAVVALANQKLLGLDSAKLNVHGGGVSLGHPLGCSGARILVTLLGVLKQKGGKYGAAGVCNGGGGASAFVVELV